MAEDKADVPDFWDALQRCLNEIRSAYKTFNEASERLDAAEARNAEAEIRNLDPEIADLLERLDATYPHDKGIKAALASFNQLPHPLTASGSRTIIARLEEMLSGRSHPQSRRRSGESVGEFIDRVCSDRHWKIPDLADKAGLDESQIYRLKKHQGVSVQTLSALAGALGCTVDDLLPLTNPRP